MGNLIKPVDYAAKLGISRQAVYAKIKKGILTSRNIGGKIFIVVDDTYEAQNTTNSTTTKPNTRPKNNTTSSQNHEALLKAKDETISILKDTVTDLKETNKMITSTMRGEVELLKEAFGEMKMLYRVQIEHQKEAQTIDVDHIADESTAESHTPKSNEIEIETITKVDDSTIQWEEDIPVDWITLSDYLSTEGISKKRAQKKIKALLKHLVRTDDPRVEKRDGELLFIVDKNMNKKLKKAIG